MVTCELTLVHKSRTIFLSKNSPIATIWNFLIFLTIIHYDVLVPYLFACSIYSFEFAIIEIVFDIFILLDIGFKLITFPSIRKHSNFKEHILRPYLK